MKSPQPVYTNGNSKFPMEVSPDGRWLLFVESRGGGNSDLRLLDIESGEVDDWVSTPFSESGGTFHESGDWVAHSSDAPGEVRLMIRSFPDGETLVPVSRGIGTGAKWLGDELFYRTRTDLVSVIVEFDDDGMPVIGEETVIMPADEVRHFDVSPDGKRLLINRFLISTRGGTIRLIKNWSQPD